MQDSNPNPSEFRKMGSFVKAIETISREWNAKQESLRLAGLSKKQAHKLHVDQRKLNFLENLELDGGPFTSAEQVINDMDTTAKGRKLGKKRFCDEITYARDTSTSLPRSHFLFRIMSKEPVTKKICVKTPEEFEDSLKTLLGNASERATVTLDDFRRVLQN